MRRGAAPEGKDRYNRGMESNNLSECPLIEAIPGKLSGEPVLKGTRVPAKLVAECLEAGETVAEVSYNYDLNPDDVQRFKSCLPPSCSLSPPHTL